MRIRTALYQQDETPVFTFNIGIWDAGRWKLTNTSLTEELTRKAYDAAGITPSYMTEVKHWIRGAPEWDYQVKIFKASWKEI